MDSALLQTLLGESTNAANQAAFLIQGNWLYLILGLVLIIVTIFLLYFLKQVIVNSILGVVAWLIVAQIFPLFGINLHLPFLPSLVVSAIFGLAGIGSMLILAFMGVI